MQINYNKFGQKLVQKIGQKIVIKRGQKFDKNWAKKFGQEHALSTISNSVKRQLVDDFEVLLIFVA